MVERELWRDIALNGRISKYLNFWICRCESVRVREKRERRSSYYIAYKVHQMRGILFCFVLERELLLFLAIEEQFFFCIWYGWNAFLFLLYLMDGVNCVEGGGRSVLLCRIYIFFFLFFLSRYLRNQLLRSIFGGQWMVQTRRTLVSRSTSVGRWIKKRE